jgi:hypothetical protein
VTGLAHAQDFGWLGCIGAELLFSAGPGMGSLLAQATHLLFQRFTKAIS